MKLFSFTRKTLLEYLREPFLWGLILAFPPLVVGIMYFAFGTPQQSMSRSLRVLVVNQDSGSPGGGELIETLSSLTFEGQPIFRVEELSNIEDGQVIVQENRAALLLIIPAEFSQALQTSAAGASAPAPALLTVYGNPASFNYIFARSFLDDFVLQYVRAVTLRPATLAISYEFVHGSGKLSDFDFITPGMIVFGVLFLSISSATTLVRERVAGTLLRLRLSRANAAQMLLGVSLAQLTIAALQLPLAFGVALACGFGSGNISFARLALALGIGLLFSLSVIGVGLMVAAFARNDGDATNLAMIPLVPMAFLSGAMYPMPRVALFTLAGQEVTIYDLMSSTHAADALRRLLVQGDGLAQLAYPLLMLALLAVVYIAVGVWLYAKNVLRKT